jgi:hypothetical protein
MEYFNAPAKVEGGKLPLYISKIIGDRLKLIPDGQLVQIVIKDRKRSKNQNDYWWAVVIPAVKAMFLERGQNLSNDEVHEALVAGVWMHTKVVTMPDGSQLEMRDTSTNLTTKEWAEKMELTMAWAAQHGVVIPAPFMDEGRLPPKER